MSIAAKQGSVTTRQHPLGRGLSDASLKSVVARVRIDPFYKTPVVRPTERLNR
jgi:hypothetical protein